MVFFYSPPYSRSHIHPLPDMPPPRITTGERRGLIALLILLIAFTILLCWRDRSLSYRHEEITQDRAISPIDHIDTLLDISSSADTTLAPRRRRRKAVGIKHATGRPVPMRSPRDERID